MSETATILSFIAGTMLLLWPGVYILCVVFRTKGWREEMLEAQRKTNKLLEGFAEKDRM